MSHRRRRLIRRWLATASLGGSSDPRIVLSGTSIAEDAAGGTVLGDLSVANSPPGVSWTYAFKAGSNAAGLWQIINGNQVALADEASLDYEDTSSYPNEFIEATSDEMTPTVIERAFTFTVTDVDESAPTVSAFTPADNAVAVSVGTTSLFITFNEAIQFGASVSVSLYETTGDVLVQEWTESDTETLVAGGDQIEAVLDAPLTANTDYYVQITSGSIEDLSGNAFAGIADETTWNFTTSATAPAAFAIGDWSIAAGDTEAEVTISSLPDDGGDTITDIEYRVDGGSAVSSGTSDTTGFTITSLTNDVEVDVEIRAVNSVGAGDWSDVKAVTPTAASTWTPLDPTTPAAIWLDIFDSNTLFQETTGASATTPAGVNDPVGTIANKGSSGGYAVAPADGNRPVLRQSGGLFYLEFDGTDDVLVLPVGLIGTTVTLGFAIRDTNGTDGTFRAFTGICAASGSDLTSANTWVLSTGESGQSTNMVIFRSSGASTAAKVAHSRGVDEVWIAKQVSGTNISLERNGASPTTATTTTHTIGSASNNPFKVGRPQTGTNGTPFRLHAVALVAADWTSGDLDSFRTYLGTTQGQSL